MSEKKKSQGKEKKITGDKKKTILLYAVVFLLAILVLTIGVFLLPIDPGSKQKISPQIHQMSRLSAKIGKLETEIQKRCKELLELKIEFSQKTGEPQTALDELGLSDEEKRRLEERINNEKKFSTKLLLGAILSKDKEISEKTAKMKSYEKQLSKPHIVKSEEEEHFQIALDYLIKEKKVGQIKALELVGKATFLDELKTGFKVWNFFSGNEYATFVTQGDASISPNELNRNRFTKVVPFKVEVGTSADKEKLEAEINSLESKRGQLISQVKNLRREKQNLQGEIKGLNIKNLDLQRTINSLFFLIDLEKNLINRDIIKGGFLRRLKLKETSPELFDRSIDLREGEIIEIYARQFKLSEISKITLYPKLFKEGTDYEIKIEDNKQKAIVTFLIPEKFRTERVVISVE